MNLIIQIFIRNCRSLSWMFALAALASPLASALEVRGEKVTQADISMMPPVCKLILENPGIHHTVGQHEHPELFERPEYNMAKNNEHLHHYCWALVFKSHYSNARSKTERDYLFSQFMGDIDYVRTNSPKDWKYFNVMLVEQAEMLKTRGDFPSSLLKIEEALQHKPDYERAYALKAKVYLEMGDKKKAIDTAQEGLNKIPQSKYLRWQLEKLGVKLPPPPEADADNNKGNADGAATTNAPSTATPSPDTKGIAPGLESQSNMPPAAATTEKNQDKPVPGTNSQPKNNPYCRFCP